MNTHPDFEELLRLLEEHGGEMFSLTRRSPRRSPFDVPGVKTRATTRDILEAIAESRSKRAEEKRPFIDK